MKGGTLVRKLTCTEMKQVNGGKYRCKYCGFTTNSALRIGLHFGVKTWHSIGGMEEI